MHMQAHLNFLSLCYVVDVYVFLAKCQIKDYYIKNFNGLEK